MAALAVVSFGAFEDLDKGFLQDILYCVGMHPLEEKIPLEFDGLEAIKRLQRLILSCTASRVVSDDLFQGHDRRNTMMFGDEASMVYTVSIGDATYEVRSTDVSADYHPGRFAPVPG